VPAARVQVVELKVPVLLVVNVTVPVGVTAPVPEASATVVLLALIVDARLKAPLLPVWTLSPP
jgi:hypothetical protein